MHIMLLYPCYFVIIVDKEMVYAICDACLSFDEKSLNANVFQRPLCWGKDEGCRTEQENRCCAAKKCRCVSYFVSFFYLKCPQMNSASCLIYIYFLNEQSKLQTHVYWCIFNHGLSIHFSRKTKKNKQKSKFLFAMQLLVYFDLPEQFDWTFWM